MKPEDLEKILIEMEWSQRRLAKEVGVTPPAVSRWLSGSNPITPQVRKLIENIYYKHLYENKMTSSYVFKDEHPINLKAFRKHSRVKQSDITELLGKSQSWISQIENGQGSLTEEEENKIIERWPEAEQFRGIIEQAPEERSEVEILLRDKIRLQEELLREKDEKIQLLKEKIDFPGQRKQKNDGSNKAG